MKVKFPLFSLVIVALFLSACAGQQNTDTNVAVSVALTQTAAALTAAPQGAAPTQPDLQPAATTAPQPPAADAVRIEFQPNTTSWYTNGDLAAGASAHSVLTALRGQQMTLWLTTEPASDPVTPYATLVVTGADGQVFTTGPGIYWSGVLPVSQDYFIEIRSLAQQDITYQIVIDIPATVIDPALGAMYEPIPASLCQDLQATASQALGVEFLSQTPAPFLDIFAGEAGQGCHIGASGNGTQFDNPYEVMTALFNSVGLGWTQQPRYQADGPTGSVTGLTRDMALMLISAGWEPAPGVQCPADQPISNCNLTPEQKIYTIDINVAQYRATFSLDGHWEDAATAFSLDLYQDWKTIYGRHTTVAQGGNKIDSLEVSINGSLQGKVATVQFQSSFTPDTGTAQITYVDVSTILWKIIDPPDGEYYLPAEATLIRK
ncbi:MAG: hypothetical protein JW730_04030 [Anaerolineales bacterium]|nr:hypothetical protein [Anaerolineales bacterium]